MRLPQQPVVGEGIVERGEERIDREGDEADDEGCREEQARDVVTPVDAAWSQ